MRINDCFTMDNPNCVVHSELIALDSVNGYEFVGGVGMLTTSSDMLKVYPIKMIPKNSKQFTVITNKGNKLSLDRAFVSQVETKRGNFFVIEWPTVIFLDFGGPGLKFLGCFGFHMDDGARGWFAADPTRVVKTDEFDFYNGCALQDLFGDKQYLAATASELEKLEPGGEVTVVYGKWDDELKDLVPIGGEVVGKYGPSIGGGGDIEEIVDKATMIKEVKIVDGKITTTYKESPEGKTKVSDANEEDTAVETRPVPSPMRKKVPLEVQESVDATAIQRAPRYKSMREFYMRVPEKKVKENEWYESVIQEVPEWRVRKKKEREERQARFPRSFTWEEEDEGGYLEGEEML